MLKYKLIALSAALPLALAMAATGRDSRISSRTASNKMASRNPAKARAVVKVASHRKMTIAGPLKDRMAKNKIPAIWMKRRRNWAKKKVRIRSKAKTKTAKARTVKDRTPAIRMARVKTSKAKTVTNAVKPWKSYWKRCANKSKAKSRTASSKINSKAKRVMVRMVKANNRVNPVRKVRTAKECNQANPAGNRVTSRG